MQKVGDEYFDNDEFREILAEYENTDGSNHSLFLDADDLTDIADYYTFVGDEGKASEAINSALDKFPGAAGPLVYKVREALKDEDLQAAYNYANQIDEKDGPDYCYVKAEILIAQDKIDEADQTLNDFFSCIDDDTKEDFILDVSDLYADYGVFDKAYQWLMLAEDREEIEYKELLCKVLIGTGRMEECIKCLNELIDYNPYSTYYWDLLTNAQILNENYESAISSSEYALAINPNDKIAMLAKANCLSKLDNHEAALEYYLRYLSIEPNDENAETSIGSCLMSLSRYDEAIGHYLAAESIASKDSPHLPYIYQELAYAYSSKGDQETALQYISMCKKYDFDHTDINILHGHILLMTGKVTEAQNIFYKAINDSDDNPQVILRIIVSIYDNNYLTTAYKLFKRLFAFAPKEFSDGYSYMALCCHDLHKHSEFRKYLMRAVTMNPDEAKAVLGFMFPKGMQPKDYYDYFITYSKDKKK